MNREQRQSKKPIWYQGQYSRATSHDHIKHAKLLQLIQNNDTTIILM